MFTASTGKCLLCGHLLCASYELTVSNVICNSCLENLDELVLGNDIDTCTSCGNPVIWTSECCSCRKAWKETPIFTEAVFIYEGLIRELIRYYKFSGLKQLSLLFAYYLEKKLKQYPFINLIPIPANPKSIKKRGWDQVLEITKHINCSRIRILPILIQAEHHSEQKKLNKTERLRSSRNKFLINSVVLDALHNHTSADNYKNILIDDIKTTGATLQSAANIVNSAGIQLNHAISLAMD